MKRFLVILLAASMLLSLLTGFAGAAEAEDVWTQIEAYEAKHLRKTRAAGNALTTADYAALSGDIAEIVMASDDYTEGSCTYNGTNAMFFWEDANGEPQGYSPSLRARIAAGATGEPTEDVTETVSYASRGGTSTGKNVYVIGPWYGRDKSFTDQYKTEGQRIAKATGGTYTLYSGTNATIDNVAKAISDGAVVIFDSHGETDYEKYTDYRDPYGQYVEDCVTGANTSYLTLTTGTGLTAADKERVTGKDGRTYYHAATQRSSGTTYYLVDGTVIANHMEKHAPHSMLWMPICLGMATEGICTPLRAKGVETVYGYSQSVTFVGDYAYEETFWSSMMEGKTVAESAAAMKKLHGSWDPAYLEEGNYFNSEAKAQRYFVAFPVVVSSEDVFPGQRTTITGNAESYGADRVQVVNSTWRLLSGCDHSYTYAVTQDPTVSAEGTLTGVCSKCSDIVSVTLPKLDTENYTYAVETPATCNAEGSAVYTWNDTTYGTFRFPVPLPKNDEHSYDAGTVTTQPNCTNEGVKTYACTRCGATKTEAIPKNGEHVFDAGTITKQPTCKAEGETFFTCTLCGATKTEPIAKLACSSAVYADLGQNAWYHEPVDYMVSNGLMNGVSPTSFAPEDHLTRAMLATILYRVSGNTAQHGHPFTDVPAGQWYSDAIAWAYDTGVVTGTSAATFRPEDNVTREQAAAMLYRFAGQPEATGDVSPFHDASDISAYAVTPLRWAVGAGIINGKSATELDPTGTATRAEIAKILAFWLAQQN